MTITRPVNFVGLHRGVDRHPFVRARRTAFSVNRECSCTLAVKVRTKNLGDRGEIRIRHHGTSILAEVENRRFVYVDPTLKRMLRSLGRSSREAER